VSAVTIRNDLSELERRGELVRTHGGAILTDRDDVELAFSLRSQLYSEQKAAIGEAAATLIGDSEAIVIDASTTALQVARHIGSRRELTVVTNSLMVAYELASVDGITVVITGGILRPVSYSLVGEIGTGVLSQFHISKGFFGAKGLTLAEGLTDADSFEVRFKRALVTACKEVIAVVDSSKWGQVATASFAAIGQVSRIFTDPGAPAEMVQALQERGVEVHLAGGEQGS
jgi:DeoR/GlpR family transcriptional regulator of sugar metabolism